MCVTAVAWGANMVRSIFLFLIIISYHVSAADRSTQSYHHSVDNDSAWFARIENVRNTFEKIYTNVSMETVKQISSDCKLALQRFNEHIVSWNQCSGNSSCSNSSWIKDVFESLPVKTYKNKYWLGSYHKCLHAQSIDQTYAKNRYCTVALFRDTNAIDAFVGTCMPATCREQDIFETITSSRQVDNFSVSCSNQDALTSDVSALTFTIICVCLMCIAGTATIVDIIALLKFLYRNPKNDSLTRSIITGSHYEKKPGLLLNTLLSFSLLSNGMRLITKPDITSEISSIHAIRVVCCLWITLHHCFGVQLHSYAIGSIVYEEGFWRPIVILSLTGTLAVDVFFMIEFGSVESNKASFLISAKLIFHRYLRLAPPFLVIMWFFSELYYYLGDGPLWPARNHLCASSWIFHVMFITNYKFMAMCLSYSWYLSCSFQLHIITVPLLWLVRRNKGFGLKLGIILILLGICLRAFVFYNQNLPPNHFVGFGNTRYLPYYDRRGNMYGWTWLRYGPFLIGIIFGRIMSENRAPNNASKRMATAAHWLCFFASSAVILLPYTWELGRVANALYSGLSRTLFATCAGWLIFADTVQNKSSLHSFFRWKIWTPISKLTYCMYLIHPLVNTFISHKSDPSIFHEPLSVYDETRIVRIFLTCIIWTTPLSILVHFLVEAPALQLERALSFFR